MLYTYAAYNRIKWKTKMYFHWFVERKLYNFTLLDPITSLP